MKIKTGELKDKALDYMVAKIESGIEPEYFNGSVWITTGSFFARVRRNVFEPSTKWSQGGPIIEREGINTLVHVTVNGVITEWKAGKDWPMSRFPYYTGSTPLIAAMRCLVASKLGDEVEIPEELK
jgi:hypothetical protein